MMVHQKDIWLQKKNKGKEWQWEQKKKKKKERNTVKNWSNNKSIAA